MKPKKPTLEDQLAFIATQHEVYPTELFQALIEAKEKGKAMSVADLIVESVSYTHLTLPTNREV